MPQLGRPQTLQGLYITAAGFTGLAVGLCCRRTYIIYMRYIHIYLYERDIYIYTYMFLFAYKYIHICT